MSRLKVAREWRRMTQAQIARATGIVYSTISRIETGTIKPTERQKQLISGVLHASPGYLFPDLETPREERHAV